MADIEHIKRDTRAFLGIGDDEPLDHITEELVREFELAFAGHGDEHTVVIREDGSAGTQEEIGVVVGVESTPSEVVRTFFGNSHFRHAGWFFWYTDPGGRTCGEQDRAGIYNPISVTWRHVVNCVGGFRGYRYVIRTKKPLS